MRTIRDVIRDRILVLDGAMGTMLQCYNLTEKDFRGNLVVGDDAEGEKTACMGNYDILNLTCPDIVADVHRRYLEAGADLIETNTFSSQRVSQSCFHLESYSYEMALQGARIARQVADRYSTVDKPRFVVGSVGPTNRRCSESSVEGTSPSLTVSREVLLNAYTEQVRGLVDGGVDGILIETVCYMQNANVALEAVQAEQRRRGTNLPIMLSFAIDEATGVIKSGEELENVLSDLSAYDIFSVGLNCCSDLSAVKSYLERLARTTPYYISLYPSAGLPDHSGEYRVSPEQMVASMREFVEQGLVNIIGGCCGTTPEYIRLLGPLTVSRKPHETNRVSS